MIDAGCPNPFASDGRLHDFIVYRFAHPAALASLVDGVVAGRNCIAIGGMGSGRRALLLAFDQDASLQIPHRCIWATPDGIPAPSEEVRDARRLEELFERLAERGLSSGEVVIADADFDAWRELRPDTMSHLVRLAAAAGASLVFGVDADPHTESSLGKCESWATFRQTSWNVIRVDRKPLTRSEAIAWLCKVSNQAGESIPDRGIETILHVAMMRGSVVPFGHEPAANTYAPFLLACAAAAWWDFGGPKWDHDIDRLVERRDQIRAQSIFSKPPEEKAAS